MFRIDLGMTVKDLLTGFAGVVTGRADYLTGCHQYLVRPTTLKSDGEARTAEWFDDSRLTIEGQSFSPAVMAIKRASGATLPGADTPAPTKS